MSVKLLTEHHLEFLNLKGGCTGSSESIHVKIPHCWKSHVAAQLLSSFLDINECDEQISDCLQICTNTQGGFMCSCYPGYLFNSVTTTCIQGKISINEYDEQISDCLQICTNTQGGYV